MQSLGPLGTVLAMTAACAMGGHAAQPQPPVEHARARFISEHAALVPGTRAWLGITFDIDPGWHLYWDGLNDTGMPIDVQAALPAGFIAGDIQWPAPHRLVLPGDLVDHVYERRVTLLFPVDVPTDAKPGSTATFNASVEWLVCSDVCVPGEAVLELKLPVAAAPAGGTPPARSSDARLFDEARARLPVPLAAAGAEVELKWSDPVLVVKSSSAKMLAFYPGSHSDDFADRAKAAALEGGTLRIEFLPPKPAGRHIEGILEVTSRDGGRSSIYAIELPPAPHEPVQPEGPAAPNR